MVLVLTVVVLQSISFSNYALTTKTTNIIYGSAPYLTFDGGRTRVTNTEALLGISLSDGRTFTPTTNNSSSTNPIELPVAGQSSADIGTLVPTNTNSIALSSLIRAPYNYWGDDDGDGQGVNGVTATGSLNLSIVDKDNNRVARNEVLTICKAPYKLTLSNGEGRLTTRYGVPNESRFSAGNATYYINPNISSPAICYARPNLRGSGISAAIWNPDKGFLTQSVTPSSYSLNFPTTGAHNLFFDLDISGVSQALSWAPVSLGGITATMTDSTSTSVRVTLTGPIAPSSQWQVQYPRVAKPSLPQVFELVGRDSSGNAVVKYGFVLRKWFVNRSNYVSTGIELSNWCIYAGYVLPRVKDLVNVSCPWRVTKPLQCGDFVGINSTSASPDNRSRRHIGAGFFSEWGDMRYYRGANFQRGAYWTKTVYSPNDLSDNVSYVVNYDGAMGYSNPRERHDNLVGLCVYPYPR
ncbi:hypothetical protein [Gilliamella sp. W8128]|uniref:hypothetical protein n=1 Tax=Gilliamella sp. W8128 TaxID=2751010 RepID=UPI0018DB3EF4|nr:hypothetical protein [Gilliamella sp. W8128]MBI0155481.1 hypothetical protein [Gilliamella sp. W8128]